MPLQISDKVLALAAQAQAELAEQFGRIDAIAEENTRKVLAAFQKHRVAEAHFAGTTGYGYDDLGRDTLDQIYADIFGTEDALVRLQFVNGTHAISCALFGALKPGDILVSAVGAPYDTMLGVIGVVDKGPGSLKSYGIEYRQVDLVDNAPDPVGLAEAVTFLPPAAYLVWLTVKGRFFPEWSHQVDIFSRFWKLLFPFLLLAGLFFLMMTAGVAFLMVMVIAVGSSGNQLSFQIGLHRLICISFGAGAQFNPRLCKRGLGTAADTAAYQHID